MRLVRLPPSPWSRRIKRMKMTVVAAIWTALTTGAAISTVEVIDAQSARPVEVVIQDKFTRQHRGTVSNEVEACSTKSGLCAIISVRHLSDWRIGQKYTLNIPEPRRNDLVVIFGALGSSWLFAHIVVALCMLFRWLLNWEDN